jgi:hypothetical protein
MLLTRITLTPGRDAKPGGVTSALVVDAIWSAVEVSDLIEHISARHGHRSIDIGIYIRTDDERLGFEIATEIVTTAVATWPLLGDWEIVPPQP